MVSYVKGRAGGHSARRHDEVQDEHSCSRKTNREEAWRAVLDDGVYDVL